MTSPLILASTSPYRMNLLTEAQIPFEAHPHRVDESVHKAENLSPFDLVRTLSSQKALSLRESFPTAWILGSDQALVFENQVLSKPGSPEANVEMLKALQGRSHLLMTGAFVAAPSGEPSTYFLEVATMRMKPLSPDQIKSYVEQDRAWDCAGGYKFEAHGHELFESVDVGDPLSIQGLPMEQLLEWWRAL